MSDARAPVEAGESRSAEPSLGGARVLVVEDEPNLAAGIAETLEAEGCSVEICGDGTEALEILLRRKWHLAVLDVMLPGLDGFSICSSLRDAGVVTPVLFLTARGDAADRIRGLRAGGDDYLSKPFHLDELLLRVGAILRRTRPRARKLEAELEFAGNRIDLRSYRAIDARGQEHELTHKEAMILKLFIEREGEVVSRDQILDRVWGYDLYPSSRTIDNFILRLRRRFEPDPEAPRHFQTVRGIGYRFSRE